MVTMQGMELKRKFETAIETAKMKNAPIIISEVQRVENIIPYSFFNIGKEQFFGERFFWKDPLQECILVGLGKCYQITSEYEAERFHYIDKTWRTFLENAIIIDNYKEIGTGPLMFGGFSFDPLKEKSARWEKYADSHFHIPAYMLTVTKNDAFLTTNIVVSKNDDSRVLERILTERKILLKSYEEQAKTNELPAVLSCNEAMPGEKWKNIVRTVVNDLHHNKQLKKVVLAREVCVTFEDNVPHDTVLNHLIEQQKESFVFAFESNGDCFTGATPERLVKKEDSNVFSACVAGSIARGSSKDEDEKLGETLLHDEKNLIEHQYVVDMIREAMEKVCHDVNIPNKPGLMKVRDIQHLYTPVTGKMGITGSLLKLVDLLHPTPALGGLPKELAVEKIRKTENLDRGMYAAPIGWLDHKGNGDFAVAIRSGLIQGKEVSLYAGCGIVKDSDADSEYIETNIKLRPMLSALGGIKI